MIAFIVQFHRMQGAKHMLARLHSYWKSGSSEMCCTFSSRMNRVARPHLGQGGNGVCTRSHISSEWECCP
jgi:hypothetical protein